MMFSEPCYVHLGLPCGTCSRARGKPMPKSLGGHMGPQPLRDANNLLGLPQLQGSDLVKVTLANKLYRAAILILLWCYKLGYLVSLENPGRSWLWQLLALLVQETNNGPFIEWYSLLESVYFDVAACVTNAQNFWQPRGCLLLWPWIAPETINMRLGVLFERKLACVVFPQSWKQNTHHFCATGWLSVFARLLSNCLFPLSNQASKSLGQQLLRHEPLVPEHSEITWLDKPSTLESHKLPGCSSLTRGS